MQFYKLVNKDPIVKFFTNWDETFIWSCLQGCMGEAYADNENQPKSAMIILGDFVCVSGEVQSELLKQLHALCGRTSMTVVPRDEAWAQAIEQVFKITRRMRYATKKDVHNFNEVTLHNFAAHLPDGYALKQINETLYHETQSIPWSRDWCSNYPSYEAYRLHGLGFAVLKGEEVVCGASSYAHYNGGIEIQIDTREDQRRKGLALSCAAKLMLTCLEKSLYPSWDAHNRASLALAEKLGYIFDREYTAFDVYF